MAADVAADANKTAHLVIGSDTKLAIEDAISTRYFLVVPSGKAAF
jgi:hypothetical protein